MQTIRISLSEIEFRKLVRGETLQFSEGQAAIEIALLDIGWSRIERAVDDAEMKVRREGIDP